MPEPLSSGSRPCQVQGAPLFICFISFTALYKGKAIHLYVFSCQPLIRASQCHVLQALSRPMGRHQAVRIYISENIRLPFHMAVCIFFPEQQPVIALCIKCQYRRWLDILPTHQTVTMPCSFKRIQCLIFLMKPYAEHTFCIFTVTVFM